MKKTVTVLIIIVLVVGILVGGGIIAFNYGMKSINDDMVENYARAMVRYVPKSLITYPFKSKTNASVDAALAKTGGFIKGICHPRNDYELIKGAGIEWNRADIPFPFDADGEIRQEYLDWKVRMQAFKDNGIEIMAVTPYPNEYNTHGIDPRDRGNEGRIKEVAAFLIKDLKDIIRAVQVTNELGMPRFLYPLKTAEDAVWFMGIHFEAIHPHKGDIIVGYNSAGPQPDHHVLMRPYHQYCDYIGVDIYAGCFSEPSGLMNQIQIFDICCAFLWSYTGLPVIIAEFGYIGGGAPKTDAERLAVLQEYGYDSEAHARENIDELIEKLPTNFQSSVRRSVKTDTPEARADYIFSLMMRDHLYREMPADVKIKGYPHTPQGQADFYSYIIPRMAAKPYIIGMIVYSWSESARCYVCGFTDCPIETKWGLVDYNQTPKPAYYAVRDAFAQVNK